MPGAATKKPADSAAEAAATAAEHTVIGLAPQTDLRLLLSQVEMQPKHEQHFSYLTAARRPNCSIQTQTRAPLLLLLLLLLLLQSI
jgi:hypothetical protein